MRSLTWRMTSEEFAEKLKLAERIKYEAQAEAKRIKEAANKQVEQIVESSNVYV